MNTLEVLGADINRESQVDMILQSLPESFKEFRLDYNMSKKIYSLFELMNELVAAEGILGTSSSSRVRPSCETLAKHSVFPNYAI